MDIVFANEEIIPQLIKTGLFEELCLVVVPRNDRVDYRVAMHTDLSVYVGEKIHIVPSLYSCVHEQIRRCFGASFCETYLIKGKSEPGQIYPNDIAYNILILKGHLLHLLKHSEPTILKETKRTVVNVNQGYSRCSCMPIGNDAIITEDFGMGRIVAGLGYDVLFIEPGHVELEGFPNGFFGGSGGQIGDKVVLNGHLSNHPEGNRIRNFITARGLTVVELNEGKLKDCGSVLHFHRNED